MFRSLSRAGIVAVLMIALTATFVLRPVSAQEASPEAVDLGSASAALGIGADTDGFVNIVHASPDAPAVDIYVAGAKAVENLAFGASTGWVNLPAGDYQVQVVPTGGTVDQAVIDATLTLEADMGYEVVATGLVADIAAQVYPVDFSELAADTARIRVLHTSPDAPAVDIAVKGGDVLIPNLAFPAASDYLEVPAGSYDLEVRVAGTMDVALDLPGVELAAGMIYDVYAIGTLAAGDLTVLPVVSSTTGAAMATPEATPEM